MKKIEHVIDSCHDCRHMRAMVETAGNTFYAGICEYGLSEGDENNPHPFTIVCTGTNKEVFDNPIKIPDNCPLENYSGIK